MTFGITFIHLWIIHSFNKLCNDLWPDETLRLSELRTPKSELRPITDLYPYPITIFGTPTPFCNSDSAFSDVFTTSDSNVKTIPTPLTPTFYNFGLRHFNDLDMWPFRLLTTSELNSDSNSDFLTTFGAPTFFDNFRSYKTFCWFRYSNCGRLYEKGGKRIMPFLHSF